MREDMFKAIVERPRWSGETTSRSRRFRDDEARPGRIGMKQGYDRRKWLNENLAPLRRWLVSQAGRPWTAVHAELCAGIDRRNTVQAHVFAHIGDIVERETTLVDGRVHAMTWGRRRVRGLWPRGLAPIEELFAELYVHPGNGLLLRNVQRPSDGQVRAAERKAAAADIAARRRDLGAGVQLHKLDGIWYRVELDALPEPNAAVDEATGKAVRIHPQVWCAVRRRLVSRKPPVPSGPRGAEALFGMQWWIYARRKRQLSGAELRQHRLTNDHAGDARRRRLWGATCEAVGGRPCDRACGRRRPARSEGCSSSGAPT